MARSRNLVPRSERRRSLDDCTEAERRHAESHRSLPVKGCWFCFHAPSEHLGHDYLVAACPDCAYDAGRGHLYSGR